MKRIVYIQGLYKARFVSESDRTITVVPLEGRLWHEKGKKFSFRKCLIKPERYQFKKRK